ncbi:unnamed protein product [Calypogeia fissa]
MEQQPHSGWEFRQLQLWEQQIQELGTPAQSTWDDKQEDLLNKYVDHWNQVHEGKSLEINYLDKVAGDLTSQKLEEDFDFGRGKGVGSHVEVANPKKALEQLATRITAKQEERDVGLHVQKQGEDLKRAGVKKNLKSKSALNLEHVHECDPCHKVTLNKSSKECSGNEQKISQDPKMKEGPDKSPDLKRSERSPFDYQPRKSQPNLNQTDFERKQVLPWAPKFQEPAIQDGDVIIFQECNNSDGHKLTKSKVGVWRNFPFKEKRSGNKFHQAIAKKECNSITSKCKNTKKLESLELKGSESSNINNGPNREESKRWTLNGSQEVISIEAKDPKGYNKMKRKGGDSLPSAFRGQEKEYKGRQEQWGQ